MWKHLLFYKMYIFERDNYVENIIMSLHKRSYYCFTYEFKVLHNYTGFDHELHHITIGLHASAVNSNNLEI